MMITLDMIGHFILALLFSSGLVLTLIQDTGNLSNFWKIGVIGSLVNFLAQSYRNFIGPIPNFLNNIEFMMFFSYLAICFWYLWRELAGPYTDDVDREYMVNFLLLGIVLMSALLFIVTQSRWFSDGTIIVFTLYGTFSLLMMIKNKWISSDGSNQLGLFMDLSGYLVALLGLIFMLSFLVINTLYTIGQILLFIGLYIILIIRIINLKHLN